MFVKLLSRNTEVMQKFSKGCGGGFLSGFGSFIVTESCHYRMVIKGLILDGNRKHILTNQ